MEEQKKKNEAWTQKRKIFEDLISHTISSQFRFFCEYEVNVGSRTSIKTENVSFEKNMRVLFSGVILRKLKRTLHV